MNEKAFLFKQTFVNNTAEQQYPISRIYTEWTKILKYLIAKLLVQGIQIAAHRPDPAHQRYEMARKETETINNCFLMHTKYFLMSCFQLSGTCFLTLKKYIF